MQFTIELDCAPGATRPGHLLPHVLEGTGVKIDPENTVVRMFGCWTWAIPDDQEAAFLKHRDAIQQRVEQLYHAGAIRYGSW